MAGVFSFIAIPILLFGKSLIWPMLAIISYELSKYLERLLVLVGDSTITSFIFKHNNKVISEYKRKHSLDISIINCY